VLDRAVTVLSALEAGPLSLAALVTTTGLARATAHRLATALEQHGLVARDGQGRFVLGPALGRLGAAAAGAPSLATLAVPVLEHLRDRTGESVQLYVRRGDERVCVVSLESPHSLRTIVPVGAVLPLSRGSAGRVLAGTSPDRPGWVESVEEREAGVASVSAPVFDRRAGQRIAAAVSVSGPVERTSRQPGRRYGAAVRAAARAVESAAGLLTESS
jgi:DNA-binding IclR family transcriptional regulator